IVAALFENDSAVTGLLTDRSRVFLSATVLGELYFGAFKSKRPSENMRRIHDLLSEVTVVACDARGRVGLWHNIRTSCERRAGRSRITISGSPRRRDATDSVSFRVTSIFRT